MKKCLLEAGSIPVVCLMGPTATGKTDAAAYLYERLDSEIISVDSSLVYQGMNIGSAKPDAAFLKRYPHHLIDVCSPNKTYSVAEFYRDACQLIEQITAKGKIPILVGGTMFYFNALEFGLTELPEANPELREQLIEQASQQGWPALHKQLASLDRLSAARIDPMDAQRIQRALEIVMLSGQTVDWHNKNKKPALSTKMIKIALAYSDRAYLHQRIKQRFDIMLEQGLEEEVKFLLQSGISAQVPAMKMIGYRQMLQYLSQDISYQQMQEKGVAATRQLAKRQLTWLRNQSDVVWWVDFGIKEKNFFHLYQSICYMLGI